MAIQDKFNRPNVIYKITKDIDLKGETLTIPEGCTLDFQGGKIFNGKLSGRVKNEYLYLENFINSDDITEGLQNCLDICGKVVGMKGDFKVSRPINISYPVSLIGEGVKLYSSIPLNFFIVNTSDVIIDNVNIKGISEGYPEKDMSTAIASYLIYLESGCNNVNINNCILSDATGGVFIEPDCHNVTISHNTIKNMVYIPNTLSSPASAGAGGYGVVCHNNTNKEPSSNIEVSNNIFDNINRHCFYPQVCVNAIFTKNHIVNSIFSIGDTCAVADSGCMPLIVSDNYMKGGKCFITSANYNASKIPNPITIVERNYIEDTNYAIGLVGGFVAKLNIVGNQIKTLGGSSSIYFRSNTQLVNSMIKDNVIESTINNSGVNRGSITFEVPERIENIQIVGNVIKVIGTADCYPSAISFAYNKNIANPIMKNIDINNNIIDSGGTETSRGVDIQENSKYNIVNISNNKIISNNADIYIYAPGDNCKNTIIKDNIYNSQINIVGAQVGLINEGNVKIG